MKKSVIVKIVITLMLAVIIFFKIEEISDCIINLKSKVLSINIMSDILALTQKNDKANLDLSLYKPFKTTGWYSDNQLIAHACGGIEGRTYTNSKEALEEAIANDFNIIEVDLMLTTDDHVILCHEGEENERNFNEFINDKIDWLYTPLDMEGLINYMIQYNNIYIVTDIKGSTEYRAKIIKKLVDYVYDNQMEDILKRIIVQIYNEDEYDAIAEVYPFDNWIFTLYMRGNDDLEQVIKYCIDKQIPVVTIPEDWISSNDYLVSA